MITLSHSKFPSAPLSVRAFSLVETVLALAVMGLAVTVLLGLLPQGMEMSRKAGVASGEARVTTNILAELSQSDWADLAAKDESIMYFDDQGVRLKDGTDTESSLLAYVARINIPAVTSVPGSNDGSTNLKRVHIDIASTGNKDFDFDREGASFSTQTSLLANMK